MAKRQTDTDKWRREWFRKLEARLKLFWLYLCDDCDFSGVWIEDFQIASINVGSPVSMADYDAFGGRIVRLSEDKIFIPRFVEFQYGPLRESAPVHQKVIRALVKRNIDPATLTPCQPSPPCKKHPCARVPSTLEEEEEREEEIEIEEEKEAEAKDKRGMGGDLRQPPAIPSQDPEWQKASTLEQTIAKLKAAGEDASDLEGWARRLSLKREVSHAS